MTTGYAGQAIKSVLNSKNGFVNSFLQMTQEQRVVISLVFCFKIGCGYDVQQTGTRTGYNSQKNGKNQMAG